MTMILLESSLMIIFMLVFRKLCRNVLSPRIVYELWLFTAFRLLPIECLFGRDIHMLSLNAFSRFFGKIPFLRDIWFEFSMVGSVVSSCNMGTGKCRCFFISTFYQFQI